MLTHYYTGSYLYLFWYNIFNNSPPHELSSWHTANGGLQAGLQSAHEPSDWQTLVSPEQTGLQAEKSGNS